MPTPTYAAGKQYPMFNLAPQTPPAAGGVSNSIPGFNNLSNSAADIIKSGMGGLPSDGPVKRANAYFGAASGMPNSDFVRNRGFDLFGEKSDAYQQRGFDNFLKLLQGYSGTVMPTAGQQIQNQQFNRELGSRERQQDANMALDQQGMDFERLKYGAGRPWDSDVSGEVSDRLGQSLGYRPQYDRKRVMI